MGIAIQFSTIIEMFDEATKKFFTESRPILMHKVDKQYRNISYSDCRRNVKLFALGLASLDVKRKDTIAIISENRPEWVVADMGIILLGDVNVPIYPTLTAKQTRLTSYVFPKCSLTFAHFFDNFLQQ